LRGRVWKESCPLVNEEIARPSQIHKAVKIFIRSRNEALPVRSATLAVLSVWGMLLEKASNALANKLVSLIEPARA